MNEQITWHSERERFDRDILPRLKRDGKKIGEEAEGGNEKAKEVIRIYTMLHRSFDPLALMLLENALKAYEEAKNER